MIHNYFKSNQLQHRLYGIKGLLDHIVILMNSDVKHTANTHTGM